MVRVIGRFIVDKDDWENFQKNAKENGFLSASECLRGRVREVNKIAVDKKRIQANV